jgi:Putative zinc-finger
VSDHLGERLSAFLDGELIADERAEVEAHLRQCAACARELEELGAVDAMARELPVQAPPGYFEALPGRVRSRVRARRRPRPVMVWMATAAAAILVAVIAPLTLTLRHAPQPARAPAMAPEAVDALKERALASEAPPMPQAAPTAFAEVPATPPAERRLQERDKSQKLARTAANGAPVAAAPAAAPTAAGGARSANAMESAAAARHDEGKAEPPAPAGFAPPPASPRSTLPAAPVRQAVEGFERERRVEEAQAKVKDVQPHSVQAESTDLRDEARPLKKAEDGAATPVPVRKAPVAGALSAHVASALPPDARFEGLRARRPASLAEARALRDAWEAFARDQPADSRADEARVRAIEAGVTAWRLGGDTADLARARAAAAAYLAADGSAQRPRVRALLETLPRSPEP